MLIVNKNEVDLVQFIDFIRLNKKYFTDYKAINIF